MKIGIMGAMPEEISILSDDLTESREETSGSRTYHIGKLEGIETVLAFSRWGKVASAITASTLITKYNIDYLIFSGVAGAIAQNLNIGDIIISDQLYQHDMDARPIFNKHEIPLTSKIFFDANSDMVISAKKAAEEFIIHDLPQTINPEILKNFSIINPTVYVGKLASGDLFVNDPLKAETLILDMPDVQAVEMEGAAVAQVCFEHNIPFVVIRTISDKSDHSAVIDFTKFISDIARYYAKGVIKNIYKNSFKALLLRGFK
jgi:adenosylhomocysteine nucleosidase